MTHEEIAAKLRDAREKAQPIAQITSFEHAFTVDDAYEVQRAAAHHVLTRTRQRLSGYKMGLTSGAKQREVKVDTTIRGYLYDDMQVPSGGRIERARYIHPRAEPELVFVLKRRLEGTASRDEIVDAIERVHIGIEVIDSRYQNFQFTLADVVADNCSAAAYVVGEAIARPLGDLPLMGVWMRKNGEVVTTGAGAAILGDPVESLVELLRLTPHGVNAGPVLAGAVTGSTTLAAGDHIEVECGSGARASLRVV